VDEYHSRAYFTQISKKSLAYQDCHSEKKLNLPACAVCGEHDEAKHMYITGSYEK